jgi:rhodanese-related sulfurtransferase
MINRALSLVLLMSLAFFVASCGSGSEANADKSLENKAGISGRIEGGLRILAFDPSEKNQDFRIYRGDYVRPEIEGGGSIHLVIEGLKVDGQYPAPEGSKAYFKVPAIGSFHYQAGDLSGVIEAVDYESATYREVSAKDAVDLIANIDPVILDVRSAREFDAGHISNSILIPVQVLQIRIGELDQYKDRTIFVYCRSGNRSTVASRMLNDKGFMQVVNLRHGLNDWRQSGFKLVK